MNDSNSIFALLSDEINQVIEYLNQGSIVLCPTDTIWGLSCDPFNPKGYTKLQQLKERPPSQPFVLLVSSIDMLKSYVHNLPPRIENLLVYFEQPVTLIYSTPANLPEYCLAKDGSVAIRVTKEPFTKHLIETFGRPLTSTSANLRGQPYPSHFGKISSDIFDNVDYIVRYGRDKAHGIPSQIFRFNNNGQLEKIRE